MKKEVKQISLRIPEKLNEDLKVESERSGISVNELIIFAIRKDLYCEKQDIDE